jgi:hypothetical protein
MWGLVFTEIWSYHRNKTKNWFSNWINRHSSTQTILIHHSTILYNSEEIQNYAGYSLVHNSVPINYCVINKIICKCVHHIPNWLSKWNKYFNKNTEFKLNTNNRRYYWSKKHHKGIKSFTKIYISDGNHKKS